MWERSQTDAEGDACQAMQRNNLARKGSWRALERSHLSLKQRHEYITGRVRVADLADYRLAEAARVAAEEDAVTLV
ncbi:hypothetical protein [Streptomyces anulatus]|uniref:hypothetical protein n=1 Tax=Streptomyces anulatus TaxID=1892 RepID=UPI0033F26B4A